MTYEEFKNIVSQLNKIQSKEGKFYSHIRVVCDGSSDKVSYQRDDAVSHQKIEKIDLQKLYKFYCGDIFTTTRAKDYKLSGKQSPSVAIVIAVKNRLRNTCFISKMLTQKEIPITEKGVSPTLQENFYKFDEIEFSLMNEEKFVKVKELKENYIPNQSGLYAIRIDNMDVLPEEFIKALKQRKHNILYIGISKGSLRQRLWHEELHIEKPATFFRSIGSMLGYRPPKNSLSLKSSNYIFCPEDIREIIQWMEENLKVNYICVNEALLESIEKGLIKKYIPLVNIKHNPYKSPQIEALRKLCVEIARSK